MKKVLTTLTLLITLCSFAFGQDDYYFEKPDNRQYNMTMISVIFIDGVEDSGQNIEIAAFCGEEIRGRMTNLDMEYIDIPDVFARYFRYLHVNSEETSGEIITFKAYNHDSGYELTSDFTIEFVADAMHGDLDNPVEIYFTTPAQPVAQLGTEKFMTLADAVEAATAENNTITLLRDAEGAGVVIDKDVTIDFGGFKYTFNEGVGDIPSNGFQIKKNRNVTLKNGALKVADSEAGKFYILVQNYSNLTVNNMTLDGTNLDKWSATDGDSYVLSNNSGNVNVIGTTTIIANNDGDLAFALDACYNPAYTAPVVTLGEGVNVQGRVELTGGQLNTTNENLTVVAKKTINGVDNGQGSVEGWNTISTPIVGGVTINEPAEEEGIHDLYRYNEKTMTWEYYKNTFSTLDLGRGYLYSNVADIDLAWEGVLNIKNVTVSLSYTDANSLAGFNMVGNPFAYNITKDNFMTTSANLADGYYEIGYDGSWIATTDGGSIAPMSSVLVKTDKAEDITIAAKAQSVAKRNESKSYLAINVANANHSDVAYVSFDEGLGLDKINHRNADIPMISVPVEGKEYAIAKMNQDVTEIPVTFKASAMGEYTISARSIACEFSQITLIDKQTGNTTNMLLEDYSFIATSNDDASRFVLKLDNGQQPTGDSHFAYVNNGEIIVSGIEGNAVVRVMDVTGRLVTECSATESVNIPTASFRSGVYMIQMMDNNGVKVQKVIID